MLKNKEIRNNVLLIAMAIITLGFFVYIFFPTATGQGQQDDKGNNKTPPPTTQPVPLKTTKPLQGQEVVEPELTELQQALEKELAEIYLTVISSPAPFKQYKIENLRKIIEESNNDILKKYMKFSFFDLRGILDMDFPAGYKGSLKFNFFLSMFLIKAVEEDVEKKLTELSAVDFEKALDFSAYQLLGNEIEKEYQALPVLFYFQMLLDRLDIFPLNDEVASFRGHLENIRDLSYSKHLLNMIDYLRFSRETESYHIEWLEYDAFPDTDDHQDYSGLKLQTIHFLKQRYLVFPCLEVENNQWIRDICDSDSGTIELRKLEIINENPLKKLMNRKILYSNLRPRFIVVLEEAKINSSELLDRLVKARLESFQQNFETLVFPEPGLTTDSNDEAFITAIEAFGNFLKQYPQQDSENN